MSILAGRLLPLATAEPAQNMSIDQMLLESVDTGGQPTLRFYQWTQPTLSLGYFQKLAERDAHPASRAISCVRRATGGGAIVHDQELTYSLSVPVANPGACIDLYRQTHAIIADALADFGIWAMPFRQTGVTFQDSSAFLCFQRRTDEDLIVSGYKVVGSAQRRGRRAVLQHGSILLRASRSAPELPGIIDLSSRGVPIRQLAMRVARGLAEQLSIGWEPDKVSDSESVRVDQIVGDRFAAVRWLNRR